MPACNIYRLFYPMLTVSEETVFDGAGLIGIGVSPSSSVRGVTSISLQAAVNSVTRIARTNGSFFSFCIVVVFKVVFKESYAFVIAGCLSRPSDPAGAGAKRDFKHTAVFQRHYKHPPNRAGNGPAPFPTVSQFFPSFPEFFPDSHKLAA